MPIRPTHIDLMDAFGRAWQIYKENLGVCIAVNVLFLVLQSAIFIPELIVPSGSVFKAPTLIVAHLAWLWLCLGATTFNLKIAAAIKAPWATCSAASAISPARSD